jgi:hypothetical protein
MKKQNLLKKGLVFSIIIFFIVLVNNPILSGNIGNSKSQLIKELPVGIPLNDDYVDAHWKFDECSGNILEDSSGHNYDGTIYESSWVTGNSECALDFDGIDDYVDLDIHAENLGFNKTDDLIFSIWFRSDSTNCGYLYCISGTQHVPEALIELCPNGSLHFKVWTSVCGIEAYSEEDHNDRSWHHAVIYFNGITAKPTIEIYIDGKLEGSRTKWLCEVIDTDFNKVKIGRRAQTEQYYFNGQVDEFKIIKYPEGNDQESPNISGPTSGYPNTEYEFTFVTDDPELDNIELTIDWGDTTFEDWFGPFESGEEVKVSHKWTQDGTYEIKAKSKDYWDDSRWSSYNIKIGNMAPNIPYITGPSLGGVGTQYKYTVSSTDPDGDDIFYFIDWDDGDTSGWIGPYPSGEISKINHTWDSKGEYYIKAKAKDIYNDESFWTDSYKVTIVENDAPTIPTIDGPNKGKKGVPLTYTFSSTDSNGDDISYYINWGDGSITNWSTFQSSGASYTDDHTWKKLGTYNIEAKSKDIYNAESEWTQLTIEIPRNRSIFNNFLYKFLENFKVLQRLLVQ